MEKIKIFYENNALTIKLLGEIDHHNARGVREAIDSKIFEKKPSLVILDLSMVDFMDSSGLGLILGRYTIVKDMEAEFKIYKPSYGVKKILELCGIERLIKIEGDETNEAC